jgi:hypothetical protein
MRAQLLALGFLSLLAGHGIAHGQEYNYIHPSSVTAADFAPPEDPGFVWEGPVIRPFNGITCWHAEPNAPTVPVGGLDDWQKIIGFIPIGNVKANAGYHQKDFRTFAGGGAQREFKAEDMPPGLFLEFKAHPVWKIVSVAYPAKDPLAILGGSKKVGVLVTAEFLAGKTMGECEFAAAAWIATSK